MKEIEAKFSAAVMTEAKNQVERMKGEVVRSLSAEFGYETAKKVSECLSPMFKAEGKFLKISPEVCFTKFYRLSQTTTSTSFEQKIEAVVSGLKLFSPSTTQIIYWEGGNLWMTIDEATEMLKSLTTSLQWHNN